MPDQRDRAKRIWIQVMKTGRWQQAPGQRTELEVQHIIEETHEWAGTEARFLRSKATLPITAGDTIGRDKDDNFVFLKSEADLEAYLAENLDETPDETFIPAEKP